MADLLLPGDSAPFFHANALDGAPRYAFDTVGGRHILMLFLGSGADAAGAEALAVLKRHDRLFDDATACFFGVTTDPSDPAERRIAQRVPGIRWFLDYDQTVWRLFGAAPHWLVLDPMLRVVARAPLDRGEDAIAILRRVLARYREPVAAPVLVIENVIEPATCQQLIAAFEAAGGEPSGFMREEGGITVAKSDPATKRRFDHHLPDGPLRSGVIARLRRFLNPPIARAFQFHATRIERCMVACYDDRQGGGFFRAHRDNTTKGTAHRKFAVTINLNGDYDGGDLRFPEFGSRTYRAPVGGAVVFSCGLLHEALPVTRGRRYAMLPFLYDEAGAQLREANLDYVTGDLKRYRAQASTGGANGS